MKKYLVIIVMLFTAIFAYAKKDWKGKVVDQNGEPLAYANVAVLSKADSTVVCGAVTTEDGTFDIVTKENDGKPIFFAQMFNTFTLKGGWQFELGAVVNSKGYSENIYLRNVYFNLIVMGIRCAHSDRE